MPQTLYKLHPEQTLHLRGFDHLGASAAIHSTSATGFTVSGAFRDAADFAVLVLYDADNYFEHPSLKYLPDTNFAGLTLTFDVRYQGLMRLESRMFATIDWPYLNVIRGDGSTARIPLIAPGRAVSVGAPGTPASTQFTVGGTGLDAYDRVTLWYQNMAFDHIVPGRRWTEVPFYASVTGATHTLQVGARAYSYVQQEGDFSANIAAALAARVNGGGGYAADPEVTAGSGSAAHIVRVETQGDSGATVLVTGSNGGGGTIYHYGPATVARALRDLINNSFYGSAPFALRAEATGATLRVTTAENGAEANRITLYATSKNAQLTLSPTTAQLTGGANEEVWRITLDFTALGIADVRSMWLTFAPPVEACNAGEAQPWSATFSNWTVGGPDAVRRLQVAGPGSRRVTALDSRCTYTGAWVAEEGFYAGGMARGTSQAGASVTVNYYADRAHELWLGTSLYGDRGSVAVRLDGQLLDAAKSLRQASEPAAASRRRLAASVAAGDHTVVLTANGDGPVYFDFLEAAVRADAPDPLPAQPKLSAALDYSTDHTYKLPPARVLWNLNQLGLTGPLNEYLGVFWWNQRVRSGAVLPEVLVSFSGEFMAGDAVFLNIGGVSIGKSVFPGDDAALIARHFEYFINATFVGVRAAASGSGVRIRSRSAEAAYRYAFSASVTGVAGSTGAVTWSGQLDAGAPGVWQVDPAIAPPLNPGAVAWHTDFYARAAALGREVTSAFSMELVNPPADFAARFPGGAAVATAVGFGNLHSTHCAFSTAMLNYHKAAYAQVAGLMAAAGLTPSLQCGEFTWWYFTDFSAQNPGGGMAYYDAETTAAAQAALGRALRVFTGPNDSPAVNGGADALFLRNRLRDYVAALQTHVRSLYPAARFELLFPYDVNYPAPAGANQLGGALNRYVNLPVEWQNKAGSGFDIFKVEALDFAAWSRNIGLHRAALGLPLELGWPRESVRALIPVFRGGYPWAADVSYATDLALNAVQVWAFDHVSLLGLDLREPNQGRSLRMG